MNPPMDMSPDSTDGSLRIQRACDTCRARKVRCDRNTPCSNCKASKLVCKTTRNVPKSSAKRVNISDTYEKKIDQIEDRLAGIENLLGNFASKLGSLDIHKDVEQVCPQPRSQKISRSPHAETSAPFEGETTMKVQSEQAQDLLQKAVESDPLIGKNEAIKSALSSLQEMVSRQGRHDEGSRFEHPMFKESLEGTDSAKMVRPPWHAVADVLEKAASYPSAWFVLEFPFLSFNNFNKTMQETYHSSGDDSTGRRIITYGILHNLFAEFATYRSLSGQTRESYRIYSSQCKVQLEFAIGQLDLFILPTFENVIALVLAGLHATEMSKPSLCWLMISQAAGLCQHLGYHRFSAMKDDSNEERRSKTNLFWYIYMMDKTLSLRLGRASVIQDWDISLPFSVDESTTRTKSLYGERSKGQAVIIYWIRVAQIQGQAYERLYSPAACSKTQKERLIAVNQLVNALNEAWSARGGASVLDLAAVSKTLEESAHHVTTSKGLPTHNRKEQDQTPFSSLFPQHTTRKYDSADSGLSIGSNAESSPWFSQKEPPILGELRQVEDLFFFSDQVVHNSTCALIQRAASTETLEFTPECLESARKALTTHQKCSEKFNVEGSEELWPAYVHWSILQAPFTPYILIFCNTILTCDQSELRLLHNFTASLESVKLISEGAAKLYRMCHLFLQIARLYVDAKHEDANIAAPELFPLATSSSSPKKRSLSATTRFDPYLNALGLVPTSGMNISSFPDLGVNNVVPSQQIADPLEPYPFSPSSGGDSTTLHPSNAGIDADIIYGQSMMPPSSRQNTVQDWFSGSRYIMGLMEQDDITMPDLEL